MSKTRARKSSAGSPPHPTQKERRANVDFVDMGDFAAGKILDPISVLLQLIEQKAPELHENLQPVPAATADALAAAPAALRPFLAAHDGGWEINEYVLCSCAEMAPSAAGLAIANHKFDEGDKLCLDVATAACTSRVYAQRVCSACWPRAAPSVPRKRRRRGFGPVRGRRVVVTTLRPNGRHASHTERCCLQATGALVHENEDGTTAAVHGAAEAYLAEFREKVGKGELTYEDGWVEVTK